MNFYAGYDKNHNISKINMMVEAGSSSHALVASADYKLNNRSTIYNSVHKIGQNGKTLASVKGKENTQTTYGDNNVTSVRHKYTWHSSGKEIHKLNYESSKK